MLRSSNPTWKAFEKPQRWDDLAGSEGGATSAPTKTATMTIGGTAQAAGMQLGAAFLGAMIAWYLVSNDIIPPGVSAGMMLGVFAILFIGGMVMGAKPRIAIVLGPVLSALYGAVAGLMSYVVAGALGAMMINNPGLVGLPANIAELPIAEQQALAVQQGSGVICQAILLTMGVAAVTLITTATGIIRIRGTVAKVITFATVAVMLVYVLGMVLRLIGFGGIPMIHEAGPVGIAFSGFVVLLAAANLIMAYQNVEDGVRAGQPKYMEWYAGYAIVSTIIWLYIEILFLLYKIYASMNSE